MEGSDLVARQYEVETGYGVGDRVRLGNTVFARPGTPGIIVGIETDLRVEEGEGLRTDPCFRVRLLTGAIVYVTPTQLERLD
jgi:hypothetical protein